MDKNTTNQLKRFAQAFKDARDNNANESQTVMILVKFFEDVLGYDTLNGEISKEISVNDRYCDFAVKLGGEIKFLVEAKTASIKTLLDKHIEQAENYASRAGLKWVLLTNGIEWQLFHLTFGEKEGIVHELAFKVDLLLGVDGDIDRLWSSIKILAKESVQQENLEKFWNQKKLLAPESLLHVLLNAEVLTVIRRELNRNAEARLEITDVFNAVKDVLSKESFEAASGIKAPSTTKRKKRRKIKQIDATTGQTHEVEIETDEDEEDNAANSIPTSQILPTESLTTNQP